MGEQPLTAPPHLGMGEEKNQENPAKPLREGELPLAQPWGHFPSSAHGRAPMEAKISPGWDGEGSRDTKKQAESVEAPPEVWGILRHPAFLGGDYSELTQADGCR